MQLWGTMNQKINEYNFKNLLWFICTFKKENSIKHVKEK